MNLRKFFPMAPVVASPAAWLAGIVFAAGAYGQQNPAQPAATQVRPAPALGAQTSANPASGSPNQTSPNQAQPNPALQNQAQANPGPTLPPPRPGFSFPAKQTLTYSVDWRVFPAATAVVHLDASGSTEHLTVNADTNGAINLLFHISDKFQSTFDRDKGCTSEFDKQTVEGRRQINSTLKLDYGRGKAILDEKNLTSGLSKHVEAPISPCLTDILTGVFYASSQIMEVGRSFDMPIVDLQKPVVVAMKVEGKEELKTPAGTFKTVRIQPTADAGIVKNRGQIWVWYTDDDRHLPVQMRARSFWGTITIRLASVEAK